MSRKTATQWAQIHTEFERGEPFSALAKAHNVSHTAIRRRAKAEGRRRPAEPSARFVPALRELAPDAPAVVTQTRVLIARMLDELDAVTTHQGELAGEILAATAADRDPRRRDAMLRATSLSSRAATLKTLAAAAKTLAQIEAPSAAAGGKKAQAMAAALTAGKDSDWGDDLEPPASALSRNWQKTRYC
jgi:hypothetical protein